MKGGAGHGWGVLWIQGALVLSSCAGYTEFEARVTTTCTLTGEEIGAVFLFGKHDCTGDCSGIIHFGQQDEDPELPLYPLYRNFPEGDDYLVYYGSEEQEGRCFVQLEEVGNDVLCAAPDGRSTCWMKIEELTPGLQD